MLSEIVVTVIISTVTAVVSVIGAWFTMREQLSQVRRDLAEVEKEQDTARVLSTQLAVAVKEIEHVVQQLNRIEKRLWDQPR